MKTLSCNIVLLTWLSLITYAFSLEIDPNGYVLYCPCMGRFGNQADHFLGSLAFAKGVNRTLVLPPWVEYVRATFKSIQIPFDRYFQVEPLLEYHRVMTMEKFMKELAPEIWPPGNRTVFCYMARSGDKKDTKEKSCNAKDGNPFGPFWDNFNIDFDKSEFYGPLLHEVSDPATREGWMSRYGPDKHLILAFTGAPAGFPVTEGNIPLQKYLVWSKYINGLAEGYIKANIPERPYLGLHMRNGGDWVRACEHLSGGQMFASAQCTGFHNEYGKLTSEVCFPPQDKVIKQVKDAVKRIKAKTVFVAADSDHMIGKLQKALKYKVPVIRREPDEPHVDLAILAKADHYICNCVSTFSHFATRERLVQGKSVEHWAFKRRHDEL